MNQVSGRRELTGAAGTAQLAVERREQIAGRQREPSRARQRRGVDHLVDRQLVEPLELRGAERPETDGYAFGAVFERGDAVDPFPFARPVDFADAALARQFGHERLGGDDPLVDETAVAVEIDVKRPRLFALVDHLDVAPLERLEEALDRLRRVAEVEEEVLDVLDLARGLSGHQARQLDQAVAEELVAFSSLRAAVAHRDQSIVAMVQSDAQALVEREALGQGMGVGALDVDRGDQRPGRFAAGIEGAVAEVLFELHPARLREAIDPPLVAKHHTERLVLRAFARALEQRDGLREIADVVDQTEAFHPRIDHPGFEKIERPGGGGDGKGSRGAARGGRPGDPAGGTEIPGDQPAVLALDGDERSPQRVEQLELLELLEQVLPDQDPFGREQAARVPRLAGRQELYVSGPDQQAARRALLAAAPAGPQQ